MKRFIIMIGALLAIAACSEPLTPIEEVEMTLNFSPYTIEPMTKAVGSLTATGVDMKQLDVWIVEGENVTEFHQASTDAGFGSVTASLNKTKTYTLYAVAHKCTSAATLSNGIIAFPDDKVTLAMFYSTTFSPATTTSLSCVMTRIVGQFRMETTDAIPSDVKKFNYSIASTYNRWNVNGTGANQVDRTGTINISTLNNDGSATVNVYIIPSNLTDQATFDITVSGMTANDVVVETKTFNDVTIKAGYRTIYRGAFFTTESVTSSFTVESDWSTFNTISF